MEVIVKHFSELSAEELFERVKEQYDKTVGAIERID